MFVNVGINNHLLVATLSAPGDTPDQSPKQVILFFIAEGFNASIHKYIVLIKELLQQDATMALFPELLFKK